MQAAGRNNERGLDKEWRLAEHGAELAGTADEVRTVGVWEGVCRRRERCHCCKGFYGSFWLELTLVKRELFKSYAQRKKEWTRRKEWKEKERKKDELVVESEEEGNEMGAQILAHICGQITHHHDLAYFHHITASSTQTADKMLKICSVHSVE
jgi:hypothetical protein